MAAIRLVRASRDLVFDLSIAICLFLLYFANGISMRGDPSNRFRGSESDEVCLRVQKLFSFECMTDMDR